MLPHLTTFSKTFQSAELNFSLINPVIERALFNIKEVDDKRTPLESLICLGGCLCVGKMHLHRRDGN